MHWHDAATWLDKERGECTHLDLIMLHNDNCARIKIHPDSFQRRPTLAQIKLVRAWKIFLIAYDAVCEWNIDRVRKYIPYYYRAA